MPRLLFALIVLSIVAPLSAAGQNADRVQARWMANANGFGAVGDPARDVEAIQVERDEAQAELDELRAEGTELAIQYNLYRDRAGYGTRRYESAVAAELALILEIALELELEIAELSAALAAATERYLAAQDLD